MTLRGVYEGNSPQDVLAFEQWLGAKVDAVLGFVGMANWNDFEGSVAWASRDLWSQIDRQIIWSVPLIVQGATLEQAATGAYNDHFRLAAQWIDQYAQGDKIYIRTGWEFNGDWMPWSAIGHAQAYIAAFRQFVDTFRSVSDRFVFEWNVNVGNHGMNPADAYPGDAYVDIVGMDFYHDPAWDPADPLLAFEQMAYRTYGLDWLENFAAAHGKPTAYTEWGVKTNNMEPYLELVREWFDSHNVVYHNLWDSNDGGYIGKLSDGTNPHTGSAYRDIFLGAAQAWPEASDAPGTFAAGSGGADTWNGTNGNDQYTSHGGGDTMRGGLGDDTYVLSSASDSVVEWSGGGVDTVVTGLGFYSLPQFVENLTFTGSGARTGLGNDAANLMIGNAGANLLDGGAGADQLEGRGGEDVLRGGSGDDQLRGGAGNDALDGGSGTDVAFYAGSAAQYDVLGFGGALVVAGGSDGTDLLQGVEQVAFVDLTMAAFPSVYSYIASYGDLIAAFGNDGLAALDHFRLYGNAEGRHATFDGLAYVASYGDLIGAIGATEALGAWHYITYGYGEGRQASFDGLDYIASHGDLIAAFGTNEDAGTQHFIQYGYGEGRHVTFDPLGYLASYGDLINAFGANADLAAVHFIQYGHGEGRHVTFEALDYIASHGDLIAAFGAQAHLGNWHFAQYGFHEGRQTTFDGLAYIASHGDLIAAFGANEDLGARHFIEYGHNEGRTISFDPAAYLARYGDLQAAFGSNFDAATAHYIVYGHNEGRDWM